MLHHFRNPFRRLTVREVAVRSLVEAEIDLLQAAAWREQYAAQETMLRGRVTRLKQTITTLNQEEPQS